MTLLNQHTPICVLVARRRAEMTRATREIKFVNWMNTAKYFAVPTFI